MPPTVLFERWKDPLASVLYHVPEDDLEDEMERHAQDEFDDGAGPAVYNKLHTKTGTSGPAVITPFGVVPLHEDNLPSKLFNFWMGHVNFPLTHELVDRLQAVEGVETLDVLTPYRFRVAIGKAFATDVVKKAMKRSLCGPEPMEWLADSLAERYRHGAVYRLPGGKTHVVCGDKTDDVTGRAREGAGVVVQW